MWIYSNERRRWRNISPKFSFNSSENSISFNVRSTYISPFSRLTSLFLLGSTLYVCSTCSRSSSTKVNLQQKCDFDLSLDCRCLPWIVDTKLTTIEYHGYAFPLAIAILYRCCCVPAKLVDPWNKQNTFFVVIRSLQLNVIFWPLQQTPNFNSLYSKLNVIIHSKMEIVSDEFWSAFGVDIVRNLNSFNSNRPIQFTKNGSAYPVRSVMVESLYEFMHFGVHFTNCKPVPWSN